MDPKRPLISPLLIPHSRLHELYAFKGSVLVSETVDSVCIRLRIQVASGKKKGDNRDSGFFRCTKTADFLVKYNLVQVYALPSITRQTVPETASKRKEKMKQRSAEYSESASERAHTHLAFLRIRLAGCSGMSGAWNEVSVHKTEK